MRKICFLLFSGLFICLFSSFAQQANVNQNEPFNNDKRTFALIIGISDYQYIRPLSYADNDAELFRDFLKSPGGGKLADENIYCLLNEEAKAANFWVKGMSWLKAKELSDGDKLYIFLAGHGDAINQDEYFFLTYDCNPAGDKNNYIVTGSVQLYNLKSRIAELTRKGVEVILIMDACRTNELPGGAEGQQTLSAAISEKKSGEILMLATGAGQESLEDQSIGTGHGLFTYYLVDGLAGMADNPEDPDKTITLEEIKNYVSQRVPVLAQEKFKRIQEPFFCCEEKIQQPLVVVDSMFLHQWETAKSLHNADGSGISRSVATRAGNDFIWGDTILPVYYKQFSDALDQYNLTGFDNSAEYYLDQMMALQPEHEITQRARASLVAEYINTAQSRINLYLQGKDFIAINRIRSQFDENETSDEVYNSLERIEKVAKKEFSEIATQLEKAISLLNDDEQIFANSLNAKLNFFKAMGFFEKKKSAESLQEALNVAYTSYNEDTTAAYILNTISSLYLQYNKPDSAVYYAKKAILFAEKWRYPYTNIAYSYRKLNNRDSAMIYYKKAIEIDPKNADGYVDLGKYYYTLGSKDRAIEYYTKALELDALNVFAHNNLGWIYKDLNQLDKAIGHFKKSIEIDPIFFNSYNGLAKTYIIQKKYDSARVYYDKALINYPDKLMGNNYIADYFTEMQQYDSAQVYYAKALRYDPQDFLTFMNLAKFYKNKQQLDSARIFLNTALQLNPSNVVVYNQLGLVFKEMKQFDSATYYMSIAADLNPTYTPVFNNLGLSYLETRQFDSARVYFHKALVQQPDNASLHNNLGLVFNEEQKNDSAKIYFNQSMRLDPQNASAYINMGTLYRKLRDFDSAKHFFRSYLERQPEHAVALNNLITIFKISRQYDSVRFLYHSLLARDTNNIQMLNNFGLFFYEVQTLDSSIHYFKKTVSLDSNYAIGWNNLGTAYNENYNYPEAIKHFQKAIAIDSRYINAYFNLGVSYMNNEQYDESILELKHAISHLPDAPETYFYLACAYSLAKQDSLGLEAIENALIRGYKYHNNLTMDPDLERLRNLREFQDMMKKYFPAKKD